MLSIVKCVAQERHSSSPVEGQIKKPRSDEMAESLNHVCKCHEMRKYRTGLRRHISGSLVGIKSSTQYVTFVDTIE